MYTSALQKGQLIFFCVVFFLGLSAFDSTDAILDRDNKIDLWEDRMGSEKEISVFPNPTNGRFYVQIPQSFEYTEIKIFNALGAEISSIKYSRQLGGRVEMDLSTEPKGIYFIKVLLLDGESVIKRLMVQ
jgi:hypothetical protein